MPLSVEQQVAVKDLVPYIIEGKATDLFVLHEGVAGSITFVPETIEEIESKVPNAPNHMKVRGLFQNSDTKNGNGRIYRQSLWKEQLSSKRVIERIGAKMWGELDHPLEGQTRMSRVSHLITRLDLMNDGRVVGEAIILNSGPGMHLQECFKVGGSVGISSRGGGTFEKDGVHVDEKTYVLDTFDFVSDESTQGARPKPVEEDVIDIDAKLTELGNLTELALPDVASGLQELHSYLEKVQVKEKNRIEDLISDFQKKYDLLKSGEESTMADAVIENQIKELTKKLDETIKVNGESKEALESTLGNTEEALERLAVRYKTLEKKYNEQVAAAEKTEKELKEFKEKYQNADTESEELSSLKEKTTGAKKLFDSTVKRLRDSYDALKTLWTEKEFLASSLDDMTERYVAATDLLEDMRNRYFAATAVLEKKMKEDGELAEDESFDDDSLELSEGGGKLKLTAAEDDDDDDLEEEEDDDLEDDDLEEEEEEEEGEEDAEEEDAEEEDDEDAKADVTERIDELMKAEKNPKAIRKVLERCETVDEVDQRYIKYLKTATKAPKTKSRDSIIKELVEARNKISKGGEEEAEAKDKKNKQVLSEDIKDKFGWAR